MVEFIEALNIIMPGINMNDTLLYGVEIKLYSLRLELKKLLKHLPSETFIWLETAQG